MRDRLFALAQRANFPTRSIEVMDGSKRSRHSNAFFTGFGRFRKIVFFRHSHRAAHRAATGIRTGTRNRPLQETPRVEVSLRFHCWRLHGFAAVAWLARQDWFYRAFGFEHHAGFAAVNVVPAMLLFALLAGTISFWFSPIVHMWSRRFEYEADAFARATMGESQSLIEALRKVDRKEPEQSDAPPVLQRLLLLTSDTARTGTRAAEQRLNNHALSVPNTERCLFRCHVERSETSLIISVARYGPNDQRFFASLRMTDFTVCRESSSLARGLMALLPRSS